MNSLLLGRHRAPLILIGVLALLAASISVTSQTHTLADLRLALRQTPGGALNVRWDAGGSAELTPPERAFERLQARAAGPLNVHWNARTGIPDFLTGGDQATRIPYTPTAAERGNPVAIARGFFDENRALFQLASADSELQQVRLEPDRQLNYAHVRMAQIYHGLPVFGKQLVVHLDQRDQIVAVNGQFAPGIAVATQPTLSRDQAENTALQDLLGAQLEPSDRARVKTEVLKDKTRLVVYVDAGGRATLTWSVSITTAAPLGQWLYFVNARRALVVHRIDQVESVKHRQTYTADNSTDIPGRLLVDEGERSRDEIAQAAHDGAGVVYDYYANTFKRDAIDGQGGAMVSTVHFGSDPEDAENAAWVGEAQQMIYGDGGRIFQPLAYGLDVVGHEFTHGIIDSTAGLVYEGQSGALNESYADVFGAMIDRANWTVGEKIVKPGRFPLPYIRSLEDPNADGNYDPRDPLSGVGQPATMDEFARLPLSRRADNGGVHINSGIPNHAAYLLAQAIGREKTEQIYYRTVTQYLTPESSFLDAANASARAATDLYAAAEVQAVRSAFGQVGINIGGADTAPVPPSTSPTPPSGPSVPEPSPQLPVGCTDLIVSGGFEDDEGWTQVVHNDTALIDTELPHTGARSAWLGGTDQEPVQILYQDVRIPANATKVQLDYFRQVHNETSGVLGFLSGEAQFTVALANPETKSTVALEELPSSRGDDTWHQATFDITKLAGKTIRLAFTAENPRGNISSFFVDDVAMVACTTGSGPAAPPTQSQDQVYLQGKLADADTGRGVNGAQIFVLKPGVSASSAAADDNLTSNEVLTVGVADSSGTYRTEAAVARGQRYSAIVVASGYRPIIADDGVDITADATNPFKVDASLRRSR
jgi:Zn-dependent metalloprotease